MAELTTLALRMRRTCDVAVSVQANKSQARETSQVQRTKTELKEEMINHYVLGKLLGMGSYGTWAAARGT